MSTILEESKWLREMWGSFRAARVLLTANNYRLFDFLTKAISAKTVSKKLKTDARATEILLDALTGIGLLRKKGNMYSNQPSTSKFLVSGSPYYQGDILRHINVLWQNWSGLDEVIKKGKPYRKVHDQEAFIIGMHNLASLKVKDIINIIGLKGIKTALDLGGGPGTYSIEMAKRGIHVTLFDRAATINISRRLIDKESTKNIEFIRGDFLTDDIGKGYDLIFASQILHSNSKNENLAMLRKCKKALNKGGRMIIQEFNLREDRAHPVSGALFSVNMLINTEGGRCYSSGEIKNWLSRAGLKKIKERLIDESVLIQGCK